MESAQLFFHLQPDDASGPRYDLDATHRWHLPGVRCSLCGARWGHVGLSYPEVSLAGTRLDRKLRDPEPVGDRALEELRSELRSLTDRSYPFLPPATGFGPLEGDAKGSAPDLAWVGAWYVACATKTAEALLKQSIRIAEPQPAAIQCSWADWRSAVELIAPAVDCLSIDSYETPPSGPCVSCGRRSGRLSSLVVRRAAVPLDIDLFRAYPESAVLIATERFRSAATNLGWRGIRWETIGIAP